MLKSVRLILVLAAFLLPAGVRAGERFDGNWMTKMSCPSKGNTEGYTWQFASTITGSNFRGEHGTAGQGGYLLVEGKIKEDGSAKLSANGLVASRKYATASSLPRVTNTATTLRRSSRTRRARAPRAKASH